MIIQQNDNNPNNAVRISEEEPSKLIIESFEFNGVSPTQAEYDLTPYQGRPFRLYVETDGSFSTDPNKNHFWLIAEALVPERQVESVETGSVDEEGNEKTELLELPLDLNTVDIYLFELPN